MLHEELCSRNDVVEAIAVSYVNTETNLLSVRHLFRKESQFSFGHEIPTAGMRIVADDKSCKRAAPEALAFHSPH